MDSSPGMRLCGLTLLLQAVLGSRLLGVPVAGPGPRCAWGMRSEFGNSVKLARKLLAETKIVTRRFVSERLAGAKLPFLPSPGLLPPISLRAQTWLALPAVQRLLAMRQALGVFRAHLAVVGRREQETGGPHLAQALEDIGLDLRDLAHHIDYQLQGCGPPAPPPLPAPRAPRHASDWTKRLESYLLLRATEAFLGRVVREFTLLHRAAPHSAPH